MVLLSFILHLILFSIFIGKAPKKTKKVYFSPTYSVNLVNMPSSPASGNKGSFRTKKTSLWKGPAANTSHVKTMSTRKHTILTIPKKSNSGVKNKTNGSKEKSMTPFQLEGGTLSGSEGQQPAQAGNAGQTGPVSSSDIRFNRYYTAVYNKIYNSWVLPGYGSKRQLEAVVNIRITKNGKILETSFEQRSGSAYFDRSVLRAIKKADPLPPLPIGFNEKYLELGIRFIPES
jgi:TonB family protein